jgi:hypothetical protein
VKAESIFELPFGEYSKEPQNAKSGRSLKSNEIEPPLSLQFRQTEVEGFDSHCSGVHGQVTSEEGSTVIKRRSLGPHWHHFGVTFNETVYFKLGTNHHGRVFLQLWTQEKHK